jgi:hypothetical protein
MPQYPNLGKRAAKRALREQGIVTEEAVLGVTMENLLGSDYKERIPEPVILFARRVLLSHKATFGRFPTKEEWMTLLMEIRERKKGEKNGMSES